MGFLGKALSFGGRFLGQAAKGAQFIGKALPHAIDATRAISNFAADPAVQSAGQNIGINPNTLRSVGVGASHFGSALGLLPGLASDVNNASVAANSALAGSKRSIAELYQQIHGNTQ